MQHVGDETAAQSDAEDKDNFGRTMAAGDFDQDGYVDLAIGAPFYDDTNGGSDEKVGAVYVLWGPIGTGTARDLVIEGEASMPMELRAAYEANLVQTGASLAVIEGSPPLLFVGSPGRVFDGVGLEPDLTDAGAGNLWRCISGTRAFDHVAEVRLFDPRTEDFFGSVVANLDNGRFVVGSRAGGAAGLFSVADVDSGELLPRALIESTDPDFAQRVFGATLDGNSIGDVAISVSTFGSNSGRVNVYLDAASATSDLDVTADVSFTITGSSNDRIGESVGFGTDVTGNGHGDIVVTATGRNELMIFQGPFTVGVALTPAAAWGTVTGFEPGLTVETLSVSTAADVLGDQLDGIHDILVGSLSNPAKAYVLEGGPHLAGVNSIAELGESVRTIRSELLPGNKYGVAVQLFEGVPGKSVGQMAVGAPGLLPSETTTGVDGPGVLRVYQFEQDRVVFRTRGAEAAAEGLDYTGAPSAALTFGHEAATRFSRLFVCLDSARPAQLYGLGDITGGAGIAEFSNLTVQGLGFATFEDLPQAGVRGAAAADFNNDGYLDLAVVAPAGDDDDNGTRLYELDPAAGLYSDVSNEIYVGGSGGDTVKEFLQNGGAVSWADYDLDGRIDLLFTPIQGVSGPLEPILLRNLMTESRRFRDVSVSSGIALPSNLGIHSRSHAWVDWDSDGDLDLFLAHEDWTGNDTAPRSRFYVNRVPEGLGFEESLLSSFDASVSPSPSQLAGDRSAAWTDLDGDGDFDLILAKEQGSSEFAYLSNSGTGGSRVFVPSRLLPEFTTRRDLAVAPVDYDLDGSMDVLVGPEAGSLARVQALRLVGDGRGGYVFNDTAALAGLDLAGGSPYFLAEDLAGTSGRDGDPDLILGRPDATSAPSDLVLQALTLTPAETVTGFLGVDSDPVASWVGVVLRGSGGVPSSGIGTKVSCTYIDPSGSTRTQVQQVDGGSMRASQGSSLIRFGLGIGGAAPSLHIKWTDGSETEIASPVINQVNEVFHRPVMTPDSAASTIVYNADLSRTVTFTWRTPYASHRRSSGIELQRVSGGGGCEVPILQDGTEADYTMRPEFVGGELAGFVHELVWTADCIPCTYKWRPFAGTLNDGEEGPQVGVKFVDLAPIYCFEF